MNRIGLKSNILPENQGSLTGQFARKYDEKNSGKICLQGLLLLTDKQSSSDWKNCKNITEF